MSSQEHGDDLVQQFDLSVDEIAQLGRRTSEIIAEYFQNLREKPVFPRDLPGALRSVADADVPVKGCDPLDVLDACRQLVVPYCTNTAHPRHFAFVNSTATVIGAFADGIASILNQNLSIRLNSPSATLIELLSLNWIKQILNYDVRSAGAFTSGGTTANFSCLAVAMRTKAGFDVASEGLQSNRKREKMIVYASEQVHACVDRSVDLLGLGGENLIKIPTDGNFKINVRVLDEKIKDGLKAGLRPFCVVANAGTTNTGAVDSLDEVAKVCQAHDLWFHVDAAYGGFAALCDEGRRLLKGLEMADSIAVDPHKWLFIPYECGCYLVKNPEHLKSTFAIQPSYIKKPGEKEELTNFIDYGVQMSRGFRGLKVWMTLKQYGTAALGKVVERNIRLTKYLEHLIEESHDLEVLSKPVLSILCFRFFPKELKLEYASSNRVVRREIDSYLDTLNMKILNELQMGGAVFPSHTVLAERFALRVCIVNYRTTEEDLGLLVQEVEKVGRRLFIRKSYSEPGFTRADTKG